MGQTAKTMGAMNKQMKLEDVQRTMQNFEKESAKMDMADEISEYRNIPQSVGRECNVGCLIFSILSDRYS